MDYKDPTELWDALEHKYVVSEDNRLLYICEQLFDFNIDTAKSIVKQAHVFQLLAREIASLGCPMPDRVVAAGVIAKLPTSWRDFTTSLKHKREDISTESLITTLDVEEKARAKDAPSTSATAENVASANVIVGKNNHNNKNKGKMQAGGKPMKTTNFKKKNTEKDNRACFVCGKGGHLTKDYRHRKTQIDGHQKKAVNVTIGKNNGDEIDPFGYGNLPFVFSAIQSSDWWVDTGANFHVCSYLSLFSSYQGMWSSSILMRNRSHVSILGVGTVKLKLTSGKIIHLKNVQHAPTINMNLISVSLLCQDGYKLVFESNKVVMPKFENFIGKVYISGGLFRLSTSDYLYNRNFASIINNKIHEADVWHSQFCHIGFDTIVRMSRLELIPKFNIVKGSKYQSCVQAKQPQKPFKSLEEKRNLAPLDLVHSDLCEMNGLLTRGGKRYFMTFIDDASRFCNIFFLKSKDEVLHYFKIYKTEVEN
jgi:hypothetical protein